MRQAHAPMTWWMQVSTGEEMLPLPHGLRLSSTRIRSPTRYLCHHSRAERGEEEEQYRRRVQITTEPKEEGRRNRDSDGHHAHHAGLYVYEDLTGS